MGLQKRHDWPGLQGNVVVESSGEIPGSSPGTGKIEQEIRFYITSLVLLACLLVSVPQHLESLESFMIAWRWSDSQEPPGVDERQSRSLRP
jgi:hypothetical protein